ncbi:unnamed protein product [Lactuca saligna]|uniref:DUF7028 domain-containing protein n=1 Tax=Lactuca saligna TaxID=75948 RepID=A0AA36ECG4_LACSI|nr:unnamed protein product [Lactuca saligna]
MVDSELRYCSPKGKTYISLRTACGSLIDHQDHHDLDVSSYIIEEGTKQDTKLVNNDESVISNSRPKKRIRIEDVESLYFRQQSEESVGNSNDSGIVDDDEKKEGTLRNRPRKALREIKKLKESEKKRK